MNQNICAIGHTVQNAILRKAFSGFFECIKIAIVNNNKQKTKKIVSFFRNYSEVINDSEKFLKILKDKEIFNKKVLTFEIAAL